MIRITNIKSFKIHFLTLSIFLYWSVVAANTVDTIDLGDSNNSPNSQEIHGAKAINSSPIFDNRARKGVREIKSSLKVKDHKLTEGMTLKQISKPSFSISKSSKENILLLEGSIDIGIISAFENALDQYPGVTGVLLESDGGNVYQARGLARIIRENSLNTYTFHHCFSSCTIVYVAGTKRYLGYNGRLGFHGYSLASISAGPLVDINKEQSRDLMYFRDQISNTSFIENIFRITSPDIWQPSVARLLQVGAAHELIAEF